MDKHSLDSNLIRILINNYKGRVEILKHHHKIEMSKRAAFQFSVFDEHTIANNGYIWYTWNRNIMVAWKRQLSTLKKQTRKNVNISKPSLKPCSVVLNYSSVSAMLDSYQLLQVCITFVGKRFLTDAVGSLSGLELDKRIETVVEIMRKDIPMMMMMK